MECVGNKDFIEAVCNSWNMTHYCASVREPMNHAVEAAKYHAAISGKTSYTKTSTSSPLLVASAPQEMLFEVNLIPYHSDQVLIVLLSVYFIHYFIIWY